MDAEFMVTTAEFVVMTAIGAFYAWLTSDILKGLWNDKMQKRRLRLARKAAAKGKYQRPT